MKKEQDGMKNLRAESRTASLERVEVVNPLFSSLSREKKTVEYVGEELTDRAN